MKLLGSLRKMGGHGLSETPSAQPTHDIWEGIDDPLLVLLVPDAAGRASYQMNIFTSTAAAEAFFDFWTLDSGRANCIAFWALSYPPRKQGAAEPIVMIREKAKVNRVYPFSFSDLDHAYAFVRAEAESGGPQLSDMLVYWAARLEIREEDGQVRMIPSSPPPFFRQARAQAPLFRLPTVIVEKTAGVPPPPTDLPTADEVISAAEAAMAAHRPAPEPEAQAPARSPEPKPEPATPAPSAEVAPPAEPKARAIGRRPRKTNGAAAGASSTHEDVVPAPIIEAAIEIVTKRSRKKNGTHPPEEAVLIELKPEASAGEPAAEPPAEPPAPASGGPTATAEEEAPEGNEERQTQEPPETDTSWMVSEMERFQNRQRWNTRNEPFSGFDSPPGRF